MVKSPRLCASPRTTIDKTFKYTEYYFGSRDNENRRSGKGDNHWTGAESLEWYSGGFFRDAMHGPGDYRWRYRNPDGAFVTHEGNFFANSIHGYGMMSYPDGRVFNGLFYKNVRWGPGVESHVSLNDDVGLWRGNRLVRLTWRPSAPSITMDLTSTNNGRTLIASHRVLLSKTLKRIGKINSALELLKRNSAQPKVAVEEWIKLHPKHCTDLGSAVCDVEGFNHSYYKENIITLEEQSNFLKKEITSDGGQRNSKSNESMEAYYAWNNDPTMIHMMKHCYKHEQQRQKYEIDLTKILSGPRRFFKPPGKHELDSRTLLMASYLGYITNVAQLVNDYEVDPNISDSQGNTAIMYAVCGNLYEIIHFLVEAGANVNRFNDSCCTALGLALMRFVCIEKNIPQVSITEAFLPPPINPSPSSKEDQLLEWKIIRDMPLTFQTGGFTGTPNKSPTTKKIKSSMTMKDVSSPKKKVEAQIQNPNFEDNETLESFSEEKILYYNINNEYQIRINDLFEITQAHGTNSVTYLFEINDMIKELERNEEDLKKALEKGPKKVLSKPLKDTIKLSKDILWQNSDKADYVSIDSADKLKQDSLSRIMLTILQLLSDGADPRLVRCPHSALFMAIISGCSELIRHLTKYGADINEIYPQIFNYTAIDVAISLPFTFDNVEIIQTLLECGADANHRLAYSGSEKSIIDPDRAGPTLLHVVLSRKVDNETEENLRREVIYFLLKHKCNATVQFKGRSAVDIAMSKNMDLLDTFIKFSNVNLNAVINSSNQTILVKLFTVPFCSTVPISERLQTLADLLLFGADPLLKCQNGDETYENLFVYILKTYRELETSNTKFSGTVGKADTKGKKSEKPKKDNKVLAKPLGKISSDETGDYKQAIDLVTECARLLHIRWLRSKLVKELIEVVNKYKHRHWNMILKEYKSKKRTGLWVTATHCLEIWDILKAVKYKLCSDGRVLKYSLYIVHFCNTRLNLKPRDPRYMTAQEKHLIESEANNIFKEYKISTGLSSEMVPLKRPYVTPELQVKGEEKFNVCFVCALPFEEEKIVCTSCRLISFCSVECLNVNLDRINCHPCSDIIRKIYYPSVSDGIV